MANKHTIILMQSSLNRSTRTFMDFESISQAMDGICGFYERKLKDLNPATRNLTYDIADLYNFIDGLADLSALVYVLFILPATRNLTYDIADLYNFIDGLADLSALVYDQQIQAYVPHDRQWIKQRTFQHLRRLASA